MDALHDSVSDRYTSKMYSACCNTTTNSSPHTLPSIITLRSSNVIKGTVLEAHATRVAIHVQRHVSSISICPVHARPDFIPLCCDSQSVLRAVALENGFVAYGFSEFCLILWKLLCCYFFFVYKFYTQILVCYNLLPLFTYNVRVQPANSQYI